MLDGGVGRIKVGGDNSTDMKERKDRVDDAVLATQASAEKGFVAGGGSTLRFICLSELEELQGKTGDFNEGMRMLFDACLAPEHKIVENAGADMSESEYGLDYGKGFDAKDYVHNTDLIERGIIDPTKVVESCVKNAATAAKNLIKTDYLIYDK